MVGEAFSSGLAHMRMGEPASALTPADCLGDGALIARRNATGCPRGSWPDIIAGVVPRKAPVTLINVGANKGYSLVNFMALWSQHQVSPLKWHQGIMKYAKNHNHRWLSQYGCGFCHDCRAHMPQKHGRTSGVAHALELTANNRNMLREVASETGLSIRVHDEAVSNVTGSMVYIPTFTGGETRSLRSIDDRLCRSSGACTESVNVTTIDEFLSRKSIRSVYQLSIDTEGHDALVLEGAEEAIRARRVALIEFEVNRNGFWTIQRRNPLFPERRTLRTVMRKLTAVGYGCFWQSSSGLVPLSGPCWRPEFDQFRRWSNILCAHEAPVVAALVRLAKEASRDRV